MNIKPMAWLSPFMWWLSDTIGTTMTYTGFIGLLIAAGRGLWWFTNKICEEE